MGAIFLNAREVIPARKELIEASHPLMVHSDASYLSKPKARSRAGGHYFLASDVPIPANNGAALNTANLIKTVVSSVAEAEMGAVYLNARKAIPSRNALI